MKARLGILGGTLDPIHCGHIEAARAACGALQLTEVLVLPSRVPPHRAVQPAASPFHRFAMAALAVNGVSGLRASDAELGVNGPSYTADTLDRLRESGTDPAQIFFITGADAFAEIATWHRYPEVLDLAHFVVVSRPGHAMEALQRRLPALAPRMRTIDPPRAHGAESFADPSILLVKANTPDVSSTAVRDRLRRGEPIVGLVPPAVERHIYQHGLYGVTVRGPADLTTADQLHGKD